MAKQALSRDSLDFSRPWDLSDVVLLVEEHRFHVHRSILAMWSPVFKGMFTAEFREKTAKEIPLPKKKVSEIHEMLLVIYPTSSKHINEYNYFFLLNLAREYMMTKLTEKCEDYLIGSLKKPQRRSVCYYGPPSQPCLDLLNIAQEYKLETLQAVCVDKAQNISLRELKDHDMYEKISFPNYRKIVEGRMEKVEQELSATEQYVRNLESAFERKVRNFQQARESELHRLESATQKIKSHASNALKKFENFVSVLEFMACTSPEGSSSSHASHGDSVDDKLTRINKSGGNLKNLYSTLSALHSDLIAIQRVNPAGSL